MCLEGVMRWMLLTVVLAYAVPARADLPAAASATLFVAAELSLATDCLQTLDAQRRPGWPESNPLLGRYPSTPAILGYFGAIMVAQAALYRWGPRWLSNTVGVATLLVQVPVISKSFALGLGLPF